jgi:hypothetical protein
MFLSLRTNYPTALQSKRKVTTPIASFSGRGLQLGLQFGEAFFDLGHSVRDLTQFLPKGNFLEPISRVFNCAHMSPSKAGAEIEIAPSRAIPNFDYRLSLGTGNAD